MKYLFLISQNYSFEILRPIQQEAIARGAQILWFVYRNTVDTTRFAENEVFTTDVREAIRFAPDACFAPGNIAPNFVPGLKVQVFHGLERKKKGHFRIRDCFDLYCTQGSIFTERFEELSKKHGNFDVVETGWPKLDNLFSSAPLQVETKGRPCILYAPTFSPSLTSVESLYDQIKDLREKEWHWLVKFHPKMAPEWVEKFRSLQNDHFQLIESGDLAPVLQRADVMISDTSSIITEFMLLNKPVVTFKNLAPEPSLINIESESELEQAIQTALSPTEELKAEISKQNAKTHPYTDGKSASRVLDATERTLKEGKKSKPLPLNLLRTLKMRRSLNYWQFFTK